jgi:hypothetical protein
MTRYLSEMQQILPIPLAIPPRSAADYRNESAAGITLACSQVERIQRGVDHAVLGTRRGDPDLCGSGSAICGYGR